MPRNVVTLVPRWLVLPSKNNRAARQRILAYIADRYRPRPGVGKALELDFPKGMGHRAAKTQVASELFAVDARWPRLFVLYPTESSLQERGE